MTLLDVFGSRHLRGEQPDPDVWHPVGNTFTVGADQIRLDKDRVWITLTQSRWEGCQVRVWADRVTVTDDVATVECRAADRPNLLTDGRWTTTVAPRALWQDRRTPQSGAPYVVDPTWSPDGNNAMYVPCDDVVAAPSGRAWRVMLTCSRWEGLWFTVPLFRVEELENEARVTLDRRDTHIRLYGGAQPLTVRARQVWDDRVNRQTIPGPTRAVARETWLTLLIARCHLRYVDTKFGRRCVVTIPRWASVHAEARVWLSPGLIPPDTDGMHLLRIPESRTVTLHTTGTTTVLTAPEFVDAATEWAQRWPRPTRGIETRAPQPLTPVTEVVIPDDLLDD